ncbi:hypothetical protein RIF29_38114 [Crotalaria pallida]|uniref:Uncharacterized protein n=1 Tax=Crotalaria pallida TaxID=3830 RepID=A0AAN9DZJ2_CROPI
MISLISSLFGSSQRAEDFPKGLRSCSFPRWIQPWSLAIVLVFSGPHIVDMAIPVSLAGPVIDLTADHSPELAEDIAFSASVLVSPASVESVSSAFVAANTSVDVITPPVKLKKTFDDAFGDCSPPPDGAPKRGTKALKK